MGLDELEIGSDPQALDREFADRFRAAHRAAYGYDIPGRGIEIVTLRLKMVGLIEKPTLAAGTTPNDRAAFVAQRAVYFDAATGWLDTPVYDRTALSTGGKIPGPAVIEEMSATTLIHPDQSAHIDPAGNLIVTLSAT